MQEKPVNKKDMQLFWGYKFIYFCSGFLYRKGFL